MEATNVVPKTQWSVSSFLNLIWKPENRLSTMLTIMMTAILVGIAYYGLHQPHFQISIERLVLTNLIIGVFIFVLSLPNSGETLFLGIIGIIISICGVIFGNGPVITIVGFSFCLMALFAIFGGYLWDKHRKYLPVFVVIALTINTWSISSSLSKPDPNFVWFSKADGKVTTEEVIVPLGFKTLEDLYFPVAKLEPAEIPAKISIFSSEESGWRKEEHFDGNLHVEFRPQNHEAYKAILGQGDFHQINIRTGISRMDALELANMEILNQLGFGLLRSEDIKIIVSGI
ncbi:TPA: hypothetical protein DCZ31_03565 [Patescibacteria group bacterium]|nr:hypothetical protein [Candidatus Gracilibacteria bacterium]